MTITIHSIHFDADNKLENFIRKKLEKIEQLHDRIIGTEVYLKLDKNGSQMRDKVAEIKVKIPGTVLFSEERSMAFESSVDVAADHILKQLKKHKEKLRS
jgi:putative sigma-54 modulation protein